MPRLIATWNGARGVWETPNLNLLCGHLVPFLETWPTSGTTRSGSLLPRATSEHPTDASVCSSPPGLLPTPSANQFECSQEAWEARRERIKAQGINGNGFGLTTAMAVQLLPTPRAWDEGGTEAVWEERQQAVMANGHCRSGLPLSMAVQLLPTPQEFDSHFDSLNISDEAAERQLHRTDGIRRRTTGSLTKDLLLLKTPTAQLAVNGGSQHPDKRKAGGHGPTLADQVEHLLPTPSVALATGGQTSRSGDRIGEPLLPSIAKAMTTPLLPTPTARLGDDTSRGADPARYKGPASLNGRRSNLDDCIAAVETQAPWLGGTTSPLSDGGSPSSDGQLPGQLSLDELENA